MIQFIARRLLAIAICSGVATFYINWPWPTWWTWMIALATAFAVPVLIFEVGQAAWNGPEGKPVRIGDPWCKECGAWHATTEPHLASLDGQSTERRL